jgi:hypothetical protein
MRRALILLVGVILGLALALQLPASGSSGNGEGKPILDFGTMAPVTGPFVGSSNPVRGVNGGGLPWQIDEAKGTLRTDGRLDVRVEGLVLFDGPPVPENLRGTNPIPSFQAIVSCLTIDQSGDATTVNVATGAFAATPTGDSRIRATVALPAPCVAPIVFVGPSGAMTWFAATGR